MFNLSTQDVVLSIENAPLVNLDGLVYQEYDKFFGNSYKISLDDSKNFERFDGQKDPRRVKLKDDNINIKKLKVFFMNSKITNALKKKFGIDVKFNSLDVWIDNKGYSLEPHVDDKTIKLHLQIYLSDNSVGTSLYGKNKKKIHTFQFKANKGYALLNNEHSVHGVDEVMEDGRVSLYARYS